MVLHLTSVGNMLDRMPHNYHLGSKEWTDNTRHQLVV